MMGGQQETNVEQGVVDVMKACGIDTALTLPCDRMKKLLPLLPQHFRGGLRTGAQHLFQRWQPMPEKGCFLQGRHVELMVDLTQNSACAFFANRLLDRVIPKTVYTR